MAELIGKEPELLNGASSTAAPSSVDRAGSVDREMAFKRVQRKRKVVGDAVAYVVVNAFLVVVWAVTDHRGSFWPGWVLGGWGMFLLLDIWNAFYRRPITDADVERELRSQR